MTVMTRIPLDQRTYYIDYLRAFMVWLVVIEHSFLPYSPHYKNMAYTPDMGGSLFFDIVHMHNDAIMMPFLFSSSGRYLDIIWSFH